jgi:hypothetical protein
MSALAALQTAVVTRLLAASGLAALVGTRIYDGEAPQETDLPYVVVGESTESRVGVLGRYGFDDSIMLHIWSGYAGRKEALDILSQIELALRPTLTLSGHTSVSLRLEFVTTLVEDDGVRHVPARYSAFTFEAA